MKKNGLLLIPTLLSRKNYRVRKPIIAENSVCYPVWRRHPLK